MNRTLKGLLGLVMLSSTAWAQEKPKGAGAAANPADSAGGALPARVDARVELLSLIFRLAGSNEYNQPLAKSPYADEADAHFGKLRDHPVVKKAAALRSERGVSYDAVMSMALHIEDTVNLRERIPFDQSPPRLDKRWGVAGARDFLAHAREFVRQTEFNRFFADHAKLYAAAAQRMTARLAERKYVQWFDGYFGARPHAEFLVIVGMLNGPCNYGAGVVFPDGREEITPVIGASEFDSDSIPVFTDAIASTVVHEFCHTYTNPIVDQWADKLEPAAVRIFATCENEMRRQAYGDWKTMLRETLVRVCVVRYLRATDGAAAAREEIRQQESRAFRWIGPLSDVLAQYEAQRERYKAFEDFMPRVVEFLSEYAERCELDAAQRKERAPRVVSMTPPNGVQNVDPDLTEIKIVFDRPMLDQAWSVVGGGPHFPEIAGQVHYDAECKVLTIPVKLKPGWSYQFWLNRNQYDSFQSKEGVKLESVEVTFQTRQK